MGATATIPNKQETIGKMLANVLFELNPARSLADWEKHVKETAQNPKLFFNGNGEGLEEYNAFVRTYDKDIHDKQRKQNKTR